jgi:quercetin dioxygenase-like cupin family protein
VRWSSFGIGRLTHADQLERHFHDADEYWLVYSGRAIVLSEGFEYELGPGDILGTRMGEEHFLGRPAQMDDFPSAEVVVIIASSPEKSSSDIRPA